MNPSPAAIAAIKTYVAAMTSPAAGWANTNAQIVTAMNTPSISNPTPQATVPTPYTVVTLLDCLTGSFATVANYPSLPAMLADINARNTGNCLNWLALLSGGTPPLITSGEASAINAVLTATELDPSWQSEISAARSELGRPVDAADIVAARAA